MKWNTNKGREKIIIVTTNKDRENNNSHFLQIHLFDIDIAGDISFKESDSFAAGDEPTIVETGIVSSSNSIFY